MKEKQGDCVTQPSGRKVPEIHHERRSVSGNQRWNTGSGLEDENEAVARFRAVGCFWSKRES